MHRALRLLLVLLGGFWLASGLLAVFGVLDFGLESGARLLGILMLANGSAFGLGARFCLRKSRAVDYVLAALLAANAILSITDDVGLLDGASFVMSSVLLGMLLIALWHGNRVGPADGADAP